ncbi:MAG TPA: autotransporter outer membrane beta-barrel domain-containing protein, partial [Caulobacter sp.]|nr:autotransporter outer membrane beta-barrel domain-containing protein [Caulobacter sp.]
FGVGLALHGGESDMKTRRLVPLPASPARFARGKQEMSFLAASGRASYRWGSDRAYVKPMIEASAVKVETKGFTETGAGAVNLVVPDQKDTYGRASVKVEVGAEFKGRSAVYRPYGRVGATYSSDAEKALFEAAFQGAPAAAASGFAVNPGLDKTTFDTELGVSVIGPKASGRLAWTGQFGDRTRNQTLSLKVAIPF